MTHTNTERAPIPTMRYRVDPQSLPHDAQQALMVWALHRCKQQGIERVAIYPAGQHTRRLDPPIFNTCGVRLAAVLDDNQTPDTLGMRVLHPDQCPSEVQAIVISSDTYEQQCAARVAGLGFRVVRPYCVLACEHEQAREAYHQRQLERLLDTWSGKLNLGCGEFPIPGWTNIDGGDGSRYDTPSHPDVIRMDVFDAMNALPDGSCDLITSEHFYEHFDLDQGHAMAVQWARLLRPGGIVRVVTPHIKIEAQILLGQHEIAGTQPYLRHKRRWLGDRHTQEAQRFVTQGMLFNFGCRLDGHRFIYDFTTLKAQLESVGLTDVRRFSFGQSQHPELRGIDRHDGGETGGQWARSIQLVVEAMKPKTDQR